MNRILAQSFGGLIIEMDGTESNFHKDISGASCFSIVDDFCVKPVFIERYGGV
jgi:hypothetical protein